MNKKFYPAVVLLAVFLGACSRESASDLMPEEVAQEQKSPYIPGVAIVKFSEDVVATLEEFGESIPILETKSVNLASMLSGLGVVSIERIVPDAGKFEERTREAGLHRWYRVTYTSELPATKAAPGYVAFPEIECFEPEVRVKSCAYFFDDPDYYKQWHYYNDGSRGKAGADVDVLPVWEEFTTGNSEVRVSVVDGGIDHKHEDLAGQVILADSFNFYTNSPILSAHGHGTHVAGTIAALNNNGIGVCGIAGGDAKAGNSGVKLVSCQVFAKNPNSEEHDYSASGVAFCLAIKWGADHGAVISNNSWGNDYNEEEEAKEDGVSSFFKECVDYFNTYAGFNELGEQVGPMAGGLVIFAAGNDGWQYAHPCDYEGVLAVGAIDINGSRTGYSNYGDWVDICAPGGSFANQAVLSTTPDNSYDFYQGTSMACPHVSGVAALVVSACGGPGFTRQMLIDKLLGGAKKGFVPTYSKIGNLVSAYGAVAYGTDLSPEVVSDYATSVKSNSVTLGWKTGLSATGKKAYGYQVIIAPDEEILTGINPADLPSDVVSSNILTRKIAAGTDVSCTVSGLQFSTDYYAAVAGYDVSGNYSPLSPVSKVTTGINHTPTIDLTFADTELRAFEVITLPFTVVDEDGHNFTYHIEGDEQVIYIKQGLAGKADVIVIDASKGDSGEYAAALVVEDEYGAVASKDLSFTILPNNAPRVIGSQENLIFDGKGKTAQIDLAALFVDDDGEDIVYKATVSAGGVIHTAIGGTTLTLTALSLGTVSVSITATDMKQDVAEVSFDVLVRDPSEEIQTFPNPVKDRLGIRLRDAVTVSISISNRSGAVMFSAEGVAIDPFHPYFVDMKGFPGGVYYVSIVGAGEDKVFTVVKR